MPRHRDADPQKFGTFGGVFTPCVLTILGVIMFLRFGHVVGQSGLWTALMIVLVAKAITLLTTLSLSAIATNKRVEGGGAYFLISRSLGVEFGGAIGIVFFLAQAISVAMYIIGFGEAFLETFPDVGFSLPVLASIVNLVVFVCVYIGAGWTIRLQYGILVILLASVVSFFAGAIPAFDPALVARNAGTAFVVGDDTFTMFALFFPAVTGIMAGANMSGDLRDPGRSIPRGTLFAVAFTGVVYAAMAVVLAGAAERSTLIEDTMVVRSLSAAEWLISAGVFAATLSSALGSMMGAPRILQALSRDNIITRLNFFAVSSGRSQEPRRATVLTFLIAQIFIVLGDLNAIAPIITMFFMITYGTLNLATFYESITNNPSYRPRFRFCHWSTALLGAVGCFGVMFLMSPTWAAAAMMVMFALYKSISMLSIRSGWGDLQSGILFARTRRNLLKLEEEFYHPKNWRPTVLALYGLIGQRDHLAVYGHWLTSGRGILTLAHVISGDVDGLAERRRNQEQLLRRFIHENELAAFPSVVVAAELAHGVESLVQCHGLGALRPNTLLMGWPADAEASTSFVPLVRTVAGMNCNVVCIRISEEIEDCWQVPPGPIDVYWRGKDNGALMLLLAHLMKQNSQWRGHDIRLIRVIPNEAGVEDVRRHLIELCETSRIQAEPVVVVDENPVAAIHRTSADAAEVYLGFQPPEEDASSNFHALMDRWAGPLRRVIFVYSAGGVELAD